MKSTSILFCFGILFFAPRVTRAQGGASAGRADGGSVSPRDNASRTGSAPTLRDTRAEVEISGTLQISERPARLFAFVSRQPCDPGRIENNIVGSVRIDPYVATNFFIEVFVPQGSTGNVCGAALDDKGKIVAFGAYRKNPLTFRGKGEVTFGDVIIPLKRLKAPVPAPEQFKR